MKTFKEYVIKNPKRLQKKMIRTNQNHWIFKSAFFGVYRNKLILFQFSMPLECKLKNSEQFNSLLFIVFSYLSFCLYSPLHSEDLRLKNGKVVKNAKIEKSSEEEIIVTTEEGFLVRIETEKIETIEKDGKVTKSFAKPTAPTNSPEFVFSQQFGNDLVILGNSLFGERLARRNNTPYTNTPEAWNVASTVSFISLLPNFRFSITSFTPLVGRSPRDTDSVFQSSSNGASKNSTVLAGFQSGQLNFDPNEIRLRRDANSLPDGFVSNMLYDFRTKAGTFGTGLLFINVFQRTSNANLGFYVLSWKLPFLEDFNPTITTNLRFTSDQGGFFQGNNHTRFALSYEFFKGEFFRITPSVQSGYQMENNNVDRKHGVTDITTRLQFNFGPFFLAGNDVYRPDLDLFDNERSYPKVNVYNNSNANDGIVADPSKVNGLENQLALEQINRQSPNAWVSQGLQQSYVGSHLTKHIFVLNFGYALRF